MEKTKTEPYGLLGLLDVIRMTDPDANALSLGTDLTTLGLDLNSFESLYSTFTSPWAESRNNLDYLLPPCYNVQPPSSSLTKIYSFSDETLFYIFYSMPQDKMQEQAAQELFSRNWNYHKELKIWLIRDLTTNLISQSPTQERGMFIFFDVLSWEKVKKEFTVMYEHLEGRSKKAER